MRVLLSLLVILSCAAVPAKAEPFLGKTNRFIVSYAMFAGGFRALDMDLSFDFKPKTYQITMKAKPYGVIGQFLPWAGEYSTTGAISGTKLVPATHEKLSLWREDSDKVSFVYKKGVLVSLKGVEKENKTTKEYNRDLDPALHKDSVDILTGAAQILSQVSSGKPCTGAPIIFDGKRRYTMKFTDKGTENLVKSEYNMAQGTAHVCELEMIPLAGYKKGKPRGYYKIQEEARAKGQLPRVWLGQLWENGPFVPVKLMLKSEYGAVFIHAQKLAR